MAEPNDTGAQADEAKADPGFEPAPEPRSLKSVPPLIRRRMALLSFKTLARIPPKFHDNLKSSPVWS